MGCADGEPASDTGRADDADRLRPPADRLRDRRPDTCRLRRRTDHRSDPVQCAPACGTRMRDQPHGALQTMVQRLSHTFDRALTLVGLVVVLAGCVSEQQTPYPRTRTPVPPTTQTRPPSQYPVPTQPTPVPQTPPPAQPQASQPKPQSTVTLALQDEAQR